MCYRTERLCVNIRYSGLALAENLECHKWGSKEKWDFKIVVR